MNLPHPPRPFDITRPLSDAQAMTLATFEDLGTLTAAAVGLRDKGHGSIISYSRKVFIPLTKLCRDSCHYCTFAKAPREAGNAYMSLDEVLAIATAGARAGCKEALFTLGDKPEMRYRAARQALTGLSQDTTLSYLAEAAALVFKETGLLPHINAGVMSQADIENLRRVSVSQGLMLETVSERLSMRGGPHFGSPDKHPRRRLETLAAAGRAGVPFTTGLLIGIGETRIERIEALLALRALQAEFGHIQEVIIQPFRAKPGTKMVGHADAPVDEQIWTVAVARLILGADANIQAPPNLSPDGLRQLVAAGINDWGGVSPVTPDHVNPEAPWPHLDALAHATADAGKTLVERLALYPSYVRRPEAWLDRAYRTPVMQLSDTAGLAREDRWSPGLDASPPKLASARDTTIFERSTDRDLERTLERATEGETPDEAAIERLFDVRGPAFQAVCAAADHVRRTVSGERVGYVVNRNINYTNVCYFKCRFCAFSKGKLSQSLRGTPYVLTDGEIARRAQEAWARGATELCLQGGIHPAYTGNTYLEICAIIKSTVPDMHIHAFSPLEIWQGATTLGIPVPDYLGRLVKAGLGSLPGTAAEILDDEVRAVLCPDKINTEQWLEVMSAAHHTGLRTTATIMFGHIERPRHWARHLLRVRALQDRTGGFTEFVPLPFVHMESPIYLKGNARAGPTFREAVLMHAVARLVFHEALPNIQASWVKLGLDGLSICLEAGANDAGGTLMNETITRAAGAAHGQEVLPGRMADVIAGAGRVPYQRTTLYAEAPLERQKAGLSAAPLAPVQSTPARELEKTGGNGKPAMPSAGSSS